MCPFYNAQLFEITRAAKGVFTHSESSCHIAKVLLTIRHDSRQIPLAARHHHTFPHRGFLHWRFAYAGPGVRRAAVLGIRKPSQQQPLQESPYQGRLSGMISTDRPSKTPSTIWAFFTAANFVANFDKPDLTDEAARSFRSLLTVPAANARPCRHSAAVANESRPARRPHAARQGLRRLASLPRRWPSVSRRLRNIAASSRPRTPPRSAAQRREAVR